MFFPRPSSFTAASLFAFAVCLTICTGTLRAVSSAPPQPTSTQLTLLAGGAPTGQISQGVVIRLSAQVTGPSNTLTRGQVRFCNAAAPHCTGTQVLGLAQITPAGTATLALIPGGGVRSYRAEFLGIGTQYAPSKSPNASLTVTAVYPTTTTLTTTSGPGTYSLAATVTGTGSPMPLAGTVSLADIAGTPGNAAFGQTTLGPSLANLSMVQGVGWPAYAPVNGDTLQTADFNGDGIPDIAGQSQSGSGLAIFLGKGDGSFTPVSTIPFPPVAYPSTSLSFIITDCDGDGIPDIIAFDIHAFYTALGKGDGTFGPLITSSLATELYSSVAGDFNRDGIVDVAAVTTNGITVFTGNGDGTFGTGPSSSLGDGNGKITTQLVAADFNNDGLLDLAAFAPGYLLSYPTNASFPATVSVMFGDGTGQFAAPAATMVYYADPSANFITGDFNGDGITDLAGIGDASTGRHDAVTILLGAGDGTFTTSIVGPILDSFSTQSSSVQTIILADLNGDGNDDIAVKLDPVSSTGDESFIYYSDVTHTATALLGTGEGTFQQASFRIASEQQSSALSVYIIPQMPSQSLLAADWNGDGIPDLLVGVNTTSLPLVLLSNLTQTAQAALTATLPADAGTHRVKAVTTPGASYAPSASSAVSLSGTQPFTDGVYQIVSKLNSSACLDVANAALTNSAPLIAFTCHGATSSNQLWRFNPVQVPEGAGVQVISANSGACMDDPAGSYNSGTPLIQFACGTPAQSNQTWRMVPSGSAFQIVSLRSGKCLSLPNDTSSDDTQVYQVDCSTDPGQLWNLNQASGAQGNAAQTLAAGPYQILPSAKPSACVDVNGGLPDNGTPVVADICATPAVPSQRWQLLPAVTSGGSGYQIVSVNSGKCLDVGGALQTAGAAVLQWACGTPAQPNQVWQFFAYGAAYEIVSVNSGKCLELPAQSGSILKQDTCAQGANPNLLWQLSLNVGEGVPVQNVTQGMAFIYNNLLESTNTYPTTICLQTTYYSSTIEASQCGVVASPTWTLVQVQTVYGLGYEIQHSLTPTMCLDMPNSLGGRSTLTPCAGGSILSQVFNLYPFTGSPGALYNNPGAQSYEIVPINSGLCLATSGFAVTETTCSEGRLFNELWTFIPTNNID